MFGIRRLVSKSAAKNVRQYSQSQLKPEITYEGFVLVGALLGAIINGAVCGHESIKEGNDFMEVSFCILGNSVVGACMGTIVAATFPISAPLYIAEYLGNHE